MVLPASLRFVVRPKPLESVLEVLLWQGNQFKNTAHEGRLSTSRNRLTELSPAYMLDRVMHPSPNTVSILSGFLLQPSVEYILPRAIPWNIGE